MKINWDFVSLGSVTQIYNGNSINAEYKKKHFLGVDKGYPFIATKDVGFNGFIDYENGVKIPFDTDYKIADSDSVFICAEGGSAGKKIGYVTQQVCFGNKLFCIKPKQNILKGKYIYYYLQSVFFQIQFQSLLTGLIGGVSASKFKNISIPVPPLSEQERIVSLLDLEFAKIDAIKANAEKQLQDAKDLFQSALKDLLIPKEGWKEGCLGDFILNLRTGLNPRQHFKLNTEDAEGYYITVRELKGFDIVVDNKTDRVNKEALLRINRRSELKIDDVLFSGTGTIGNTALISELPQDWNIKEGIYAITPKHNLINSRFLIYLLGSDFFLKEARKKAEGTGVMSVPMKRFVNLLVGVPSLEKQILIAEKLDVLSEKIKELQSNYEQTITLCNDLKQSILKDIFG